MRVCGRGETSGSLWRRLFSKHFDDLDALPSRIVRECDWNHGPTAMDKRIRNRMKFGPHL